MEFIGRTVRKDFKGFGVFAGVVNSYNSSTGFFKIVYEDGDSEELEMPEVLSLLNRHHDGEVELVVGDHQSELTKKPPSKVGRKPKKRRRSSLAQVQVVGAAADSGNDSAFLANSSCLKSDGLANKTLEEKLGDIGHGIHNVEDSGVVKRNRIGQLTASCDVNLNDGLDLNRGLDLNEDDAGEMNVTENLRGNGVIDLNLDLNVEDNWDSVQEGSRNLVVVKREHCFDLNLGLDEESKNPDADFDGQLKENASCRMSEETHLAEILGEVDGTQMDGGSSENLMSDGIFRGNMKTDDGVGVLDAYFVNYRTSDIQVKDLSGPGAMPANHIQVSTEKPHKERKVGKRRKLSDSGNSLTDTVLRRSKRRGRATFSAEDHVPSATEFEAVNDGLFSPAVSAVSEDQPTISGREESDKLSILPPKLQLPPSSAYLNLDGIPVLDLFSVYAFLRSFSNLLFLSPFKLEDFVASIRCRTPNLLIDFIHVSLLQTLRKHMEFLSDESSLSASNCLRDLNWDLLDLVTWPIFLVEYLLLQSSAMKPGFDLCHLKLFENGYYRQPESVKVDILRCLCDDVIEVEAIKSELNRRTMLNEPSSNTDFDRNTKFESSKKRKAVMDASGSSCVTEEVVEEDADWNSDECCLCKMDGNLICCDGCPAAFHARCVGVATSLLPEGDWYCPECVIDRDNPWMKVGKSIRGAELLGIDPYGRLYYGSCGYLLVSDPCEAESSCHYYHNHDLAVVIGALGSSDSHYGSILSAITTHWNVCTKRCGMDPDNASFLESLMKGQLPATTMPPVPLVSSETCAKDETVNGGKPREKCIPSTYNVNEKCEVPEVVNIGPLAGNSMKIENPLANSEGSAEIFQSISGIQNFQSPEPDCSKRSDGVSGKPAVVGDLSLTSTNIDVEQVKNVQSKNRGRPSSKVSRRGDAPLHQLGSRYVNLYSFARTAWSVAEDLTRKSFDKITQESARSVEELISAQLKAISHAYDEFCWSNIQNLNADARKEKCGWCIACKVPDYEEDCLFLMNNSAPTFERFTSNELGLHSRKNRKGRLIDVMCHILCIEDRLHGLLSGPWLNTHFPKLWRKSLLKASDTVSVKKLLLLLESNIRPLALSADWLKHVDSVATIGSASHIVTSSVRVPSKHVIGRKRSRGPDSEPNSSSNASSGLGLLWWRGGKISRHLFNWKVLPHSFASKAARQAGCKKIPGVLYPDSSEFAKRSKYAAWRASVETSVSAEQLAVLVRELHANIRWDDIENSNRLLSMDKESQKSVRSFKKVIIRRKSVEGAEVKYLLDFGKRRFIPDIVSKHGSKLEDSASERKRYWLEESYVPLHLLKGFEEKRIARKSNKICSGNLLVTGRVMKKPSKKEGFSYLFSKAERSENYQCGHCNKDVLIREAVSCQYCEGFFHKRHVKKSTGAISAECKYTCHKCQGRKHAKADANKGKPQLQKVKKASKVLKPGRPKISKKACKGKQPAQSKTKKNVPVVVPLRRSARKAKVVLLPSKKTEGPKKGKQSKSKKVRTKKPKKDNLQKKRAQVYYTYWLNGLQLSRKPNDERVIHFQSKNYLAPFSQLAAMFSRPKCSLCHEREFTSSLNYICCEICGDWFHGDAFGLKAENINNLIGFKCHKCRNRTPPVCPHFHSTRSDEVQSGELKNDVGSECGDEVSNAIALPSEAVEKQTSRTVEESKKLTLTGVSIQKELHTGTVPHLIQKLSSDAEDADIPFALEERTEPTHRLDEKDSPDALMEPNENTLSNLEQKLEPTYKLDEKDSPDTLMEPNENTFSTLEQKTEPTCNSDEKGSPDTLLDPNENTLPDDKLLATILVGPESTLSEYNVHVSGKELIPLRQNHVKNGFLNTTANLTSEVNESLIASSERPPQEAILDSGELLDRCVD